MNKSPYDLWIEADEDPAKFVELMKAGGFLEGRCRSRWRAGFIIPPTGAIPDGARCTKPLHNQDEPCAYLDSEKNIQLRGGK